MRRYLQYISLLFRYWNFYSYFFISINMQRKYIVYFGRKLAQTFLWSKLSYATWGGGSLWSKSPSPQIAGFNTELYISYVMLIHNFNKTRDGLLVWRCVQPFPVSPYAPNVPCDSNYYGIYFYRKLNEYIFPIFILGCRKSDCLSDSLPDGQILLWRLITEDNSALSSFEHSCINSK